MFSESHPLDEMVTCDESRSLFGGNCVLSNSPNSTETSPRIQAPLSSVKHFTRNPFHAMKVVSNSPFHDFLFKFLQVAVLGFFSFSS